jgi:hypothetical protein
VCLQRTSSTASNEHGGNARCAFASAVLATCLQHLVVEFFIGRHPFVLIKPSSSSDIEREDYDKAFATRRRFACR